MRRGLQWLTVTAMPARRTRPDRQPAAERHGKHGELRHGDGEAHFHMYITGDTLLVDELAEIGRRHPDIDLCMLHLGGTRIAGILLTMDGKQGVRLLELLRPKTAIPIHYDDYTVFRSPPKDFLDAAAQAQLSTRIVPIVRGSTYRFDVGQADPGGDDAFARTFNTFIEHVDRGWAMCAHVDGQRRVISRHPTAEPRRAERELNESANRSANRSVDNSG